MTRSLPRSLPLFSALLLSATALPAFAHATQASTPHWHASDWAGLLAVAASMLGAVWLDRRAVRAERDRLTDRSHGRPAR